MITHTIPIRTVSENNNSDHRMVKYKRAKGQRNATYLFLKLGDVPPDGPLTIRLTRIGKREMDGDNLQGALKAVRDATADAIRFLRKQKPLAPGRADGEHVWLYEQVTGKEYAVKIEIWGE